MNKENLKSPPSSQWSCSIFWLIPLALVFGILLVVGAFALVNWALPSDDAKLLKNLFGLTIGGSTGGAALTGAIGFVQRSLRLTDAKVQSFHFDEEDARQSAVALDEFDPMNPKYDHLLAVQEAPAPVFEDSIPRGAVKDSE